MDHREFPYDRILGHVGVLVLVNEDKAEAFIELLAQRFGIGKHCGDVQQQVIKIDRVGFQ